MSVTIYVEGGGESKELRARCREGFSKLIEKAGFATRMPRIVACGTRRNAYDSFVTASKDPTSLAMLLVDSEEPVERPPWEHLQARDNWQRPSGTNDDQIHLMVTCMETWLMADRAALAAVFGSCLQAGALLPLDRLESRPCHEVLELLAHATRECGRTKQYAKGKLSFQLLAAVQPEQLRSLPSFQRLIDALARRL